MSFIAGVVSVTVKRPLKVGVCGCKSAADVGQLQFVEGMVDTAKYVTAFEARMLLLAKEELPE